MKLHNTWNTFLNALYVKDFKCIICGKEIQENHNYCICNKCFKALPFIIKRCSICGGNIKSDLICTACKQRVEDITTNISVFNYKFPINHLITSLKYENKTYLAPYLSSFLVDKYIECNLKVDYIVPVPINRERFKERGFNQAELLC